MPGGNGSAVEAARVSLAIALLIVCIAIITWDVIAVYRIGWEGTVSAIMQDWSMKLPVLPFALGILAGHLFWPTRPTPVG